jgi:hypothetical protein
VSSNTGILPPRIRPALAAQPFPCSSRMKIAPSPCSSRVRQDSPLITQSAPRSPRGLAGTGFQNPCSSRCRPWRPSRSWRETGRSSREARQDRQEDSQEQDFRIPVLLDAVLGALCALGVRRAVHHAKRAKTTRNSWLLSVVAAVTRLWHSSRVGLTTWRHVRMMSPHGQRQR